MHDLYMRTEKPFIDVEIPAPDNSLLLKAAHLGVLIAISLAVGYIPEFKGGIPYLGDLILGRIRSGN